jgi:hypothetical protein
VRTVEFLGTHVLGRSFQCRARAGSVVRTGGRQEIVNVMTHGPSRPPSWWDFLVTAAARMKRRCTAHWRESSQSSQTPFKSPGPQKVGFFFFEYSTVHTKARSREGIESSRILAFGTANKRKVCKHCIIYDKATGLILFSRTTIRRPGKSFLVTILITRGTNMFCTVFFSTKHFSMHALSHSDSVRRLFLGCSRTDTSWSSP